MSRWIIKFIIIMAVLTPPCPTPFPISGEAAASPAESSTALDFALFLFREGDYPNAVGEAKRFLFFHPKHPRAGEARDLLRRAGDKLEHTVKPAVSGSKSSQGGTALTSLIRLYQKRLRSFKNPKRSCPSYPNCSEYAIQAIRKHGGLLGSFIYVDRFWREVTTVNTPPQVTYQGRSLHYDPLENNDYWLTKSTEEK